MKILFVSSEVYPLNKTGGLGDVIYSLPKALAEQGADVRLLLPAYRDVLNQVQDLKLLSQMDLIGVDCVHSARIFQTTHQDIDIPIYLFDCQALFDRSGNPYLQMDGSSWPDNAERFTVFSRAAALLASQGTSDGWQPDVVHCHDWQTGLVAALLEDMSPRPKRVFTIHNLAYGGHYSAEIYNLLKLPVNLWSTTGLEFYGGFSMLKAGIIYSDIVTTVSPTYAKEILTTEHGCGLEGVLKAEEHKLYGILNGIDTEQWSPDTDKLLAASYSVKDSSVRRAKKINKQALLHGLDIEVTKAMLSAPLLGTVGRLAEQKGIDLILGVIPEVLAKTDCNFVIIGTGDKQYEKRLLSMQTQHPDRVFVWLGFSEPLAHLLEAGSDMFLMPSRFEPCGLNQMYSLRYGTPPIVRKTGGLADTVIDSNKETLRSKQANGFVFDEMSKEAMLDSIYRALDYWKKPTQWKKIVFNGMSQDMCWTQRAKEYTHLYQQ